MIHVKYDRSGKWSVTKFVKEHNHPLVVEPRQARQSLDEKDKRIQELTIESDRMSKKVESVVKNLKEFEHIELELLHSKQDGLLSQL